MKTNKGYIVAMYNRTKRIVVISLEMWELIRNTEDYTPLYRTDNAKDAYNYVYELSSNVQNEPNMVNKQDFINKAKEWILKNFHSNVHGDSLYYSRFNYQPEDIANDFCKAMEEE